MELFKKVSSVIGAGVLAVGLTGAAYGLVGAGSGGSTPPPTDPCAALKPQKFPGGVMNNVNSQFAYLNCLTQAAGQSGTQADPCASLKPQSLGFQGLGGIKGIGSLPGATSDAYIKCLIDATQGATPTGSNGTGGPNGATGGGGKATPNADAHTGTGSAPASGGPVNFNVTNNNTSSNSNANSNTNTQNQGQPPVHETPPVVVDPTPPPPTPPVPDSSGSMTDRVAATPRVLSPPQP